jgi:peptidoglycan/LPS O-acetylase OafA/YrhL
MSEDDVTPPPRAHGRRRGTPRDESAAPPPSSSGESRPTPARGRRARRIAEPVDPAETGRAAEPGEPVAPVEPAEPGQPEAPASDPARATQPPRPVEDPLDAWLEPVDLDGDLGYPVEFEGSAEAPVDTPPPSDAPPAEPTGAGEPTGAEPAEAEPTDADTASAPADQTHQTHQTHPAHTPSDPTGAPSAPSAPSTPSAPSSEPRPRALPTHDALARAVRPRSPGAEAALSAPFRVEIHGLRAIAILLVAVYHIWFGRVSGGVDVFLFISAFLLTGSFARRLESGRPLAVPRYWLKTFKRLLPPAVVTILGSLVIAFTVLPATTWGTVQRQAWASALYIQNYVLAADSVDYYAHDAAAASPLQHFWSMSIQGQIFVIWPLLFALGALLLRLRILRDRPRAASPRRVMAGIFAIVLVASLIWSIVSTSSQQTFAYFDTAARLWEFAAGSLLGLALPRIDRATGATASAAIRPRGGALRAVLGWVGLAGLLSCGALLDVEGMFPGWIAIWPLASAALVILAGRSGRSWGADAFLSLRPVAFLGSIAYALYLVHWPLLIGWLALAGEERAGLLDGAVVLAIALVVAWLLTRLVDTPVRRSPWLDARAHRGLAAVALSLAVVLVGSQAVFPALTERSLTVAQPVQPSPSAASDGGGVAPPTVPNPGAQWTVDPLTDGFGATIPSPEEAPEPSEQTYEEDCHEDLGLPDTVTCRYTPAPDGDPSLTIALAGDSHAGQYTGAVLEAAEEKNWAVYYIGHSGCTFTTDPVDSQCRDLNTSWETLIDGVDPDVLVTMGTRTSFDGGSDTEKDRENLDSALPLTTERGIPVLLLRDNPRWPKKEESGNRFDCAFEVLRDGGDAREADAECGDDMANRMAPQNPSAHRASDDPYAPIRIADPATDVLCPDGRCSPVMGNVFVYRDSYHVSDAFSRTMEPWFTEQIEATVAMKDPDAVER